MSGKINAHVVPAGTLSSTFFTIVIHPYVLSNGGFINTLVTLLPWFSPSNFTYISRIHLDASSVLESSCSKFVFPSLWINIFAHANAYISLSNSIPYSCLPFISVAFLVLMPPASLIILHIDLTKKAPEPQAASKTTSFWVTSINLYIKDVIWSGVNTCPLSDFPLYLLNSLKKMAITSSPFHLSDLIKSEISLTQSMKLSIATWLFVVFILISEYTSQSKSSFSFCFLASFNDFDNWFSIVWWNNEYSVPLCRIAPSFTATNAHAVNIIRWFKFFTPNSLCKQLFIFFVNSYILPLSIVSGTNNCV